MFSAAASFFPSITLWFCTRKRFIKIKINILSCVRYLVFLKLCEVIQSEKRDSPQSSLRVPGRCTHIRGAGCLQIASQNWTEKKTVHKMMRKQCRGQHLPNKSCLSSFPIQSVNGTFLFEFWLSHQPRGTDRSSSACVSLYVTLGPTFKYAVWNFCIKCWTEQHWMDSSSFQPRPLPTEGKHPPLEKSTFMMSQFVQYVSLLMRGEPGDIKSSRHQNVSKKGSSHGNSEHEEIQLLG